MTNHLQTQFKKRNRQLEESHRPLVDLKTIFSISSPLRNLLKQVEMGKVSEHYAVMLNQIQQIFLANSMLLPIKLKSSRCHKLLKISINLPSLWLINRKNGKKPKNLKKIEWRKNLQQKKQSLSLNERRLVKL